MSVTRKNETHPRELNVDDMLNQAQPGKRGGFKGVLGTIGRAAANILIPGLGGVLGGGISGRLLGAALPGLGSETTQFLALQQKLQQEQLAFETISTVLKIRADTSMSAIRNMSVK